jgi:hypothetical protein
MTFESNPYDPSNLDSAEGASGAEGVGGGGGAGAGGGKTRLLGRIPRAALVGGLFFGLILGGTGIGFAAASSSSSSSSTPSTTTPDNGPHAKGRMHGFGRFLAPGFGLKFGGDLVHGQATIHTSSGYKTVYFQVGSASDISSTSITVTSSDGFTQVYTVDPSTVVDAQRDGISSIAAKDQVRIFATKSGSTETAVNIVDVTKLQSSGAHFGLGWAKPGAPSEPSGTSGTSGPGPAGFPGFPPGPALGTTGSGELS